MKNKILFVLLTITLMVNFFSNRDVIRQIKEMQRYNVHAIVDMAKFAMEQYYITGNLQIGESIDKSNVIEYNSENPDIHDYFEEYGYSAVMIDENTVMITTDVFFDNVSGYLFTYKTNIPIGKYNVPYGEFKNGCIDIKSEKYTHIYYWKAIY